MTSRHRPLLAAACADQAEVLALSVTRFIAAGYMTSDAACWDAAHACAEELLGVAAGPKLVAAFAGVMRALKAERHEPWSFMPAPCCRITEDEADLLAALQVARRGDPPALRQASLRLARIEAAPRLAAALAAAAETLEALVPALADAGKPGALRRMH
ncbi:MAG TPA: hypothetical protein VHL98_02550 [Microvirga sp.]|jgi:hypothetical protein|nr:hypothetical protein [Microvirga sp.]